MNLAESVLMRQDKRMQDDMKTMQQKLKETEVNAVVSGVSVTMLGSGEVKKIIIDQNLIDPAEKRNAGRCIGCSAESGTRENGCAGRF